MLCRFHESSSLVRGRQDRRSLSNLTSCGFNAERRVRVSYCHMTVLQLFLEQEKRWN